MYNNIITCAVILALIVSGCSTAQVIEVTPDVLNFGDVLFDEVSELSLTITHIGEEDLNYSLRWSDSANFGILILEAEEAKETILVIYSAAEEYREDNGYSPGNHVPAFQIIS
jgi:hypothetical protein